MKKLVLSILLLYLSLSCNAQIQTTGDLELGG